MFRSLPIEIEGRQFPAQVLLPQPLRPGQRYPLLVFLHGAGERGTDNHKQLTWLPKLMAEPRQREQLPCFLLAVQCPEDSKWVEVPWDSTESQPMPAAPSLPLRAVVAAMQQLLAAEPIDPDRVYLTGLSMGGYGAFDLASRYPDWFAAVLPVCGGGDVLQATRLRGLPIWAWHGDADPAVPVQQSRLMVSALRALGSDVQYTELPGVGHDSWRQAYGDGGGLGWLFLQRRRR